MNVFLAILGVRGVALSSLASIDFSIVSKDLLWVLVLSGEMSLREAYGVLLV